MKRFLLNVRDWTMCFIYAALLWGVEIAWLICLGIVIVKLIR